MSINLVNDDFVQFLMNDFDILVNSTLSFIINKPCMHYFLPIAIHLLLIFYRHNIVFRVLRDSQTWT